jgi:hypothetical protein
MNVPCSSTPAGPCARPLPRCGVVFRHLDSVDSRHFSHFGAQLHGPLTRCLRFAGWVAAPLRKTRFRMAGQPFRAGLATRWVLNERFQVIPFSFPRLCLAHPNRERSSTPIVPKRPSPMVPIRAYVLQPARKKRAGKLNRQARPQAANLNWVGFVDIGAFRLIFGESLLASTELSSTVHQFWFVPH